MNMKTANAIFIDAVDLLEKQTTGQIAELEHRLEVLKATLPEFAKLRAFYKNSRSEILEHVGKKYVMIYNENGHCEGCDFFTKDIFNVTDCSRPQNFPSCCVNRFTKDTKDNEFYHFNRII